MIKTVGAVIVRRNKILLTKRNVRLFKNYWSLPGGKVEKNESLKKAIKREVKEETNLDLENVRYLCEMDEMFPEKKWNPHSSFFVCECKGRIKINKEVKDYGWFSLKEGLRKRLAFHHRKVLEEYERYRKSC